MQAASTAAAYHLHKLFKRLFWDMLSLAWPDRYFFLQGVYR